MHRVQEAPTELCLNKLLGHLGNTFVSVVPLVQVPYLVSFSSKYCGFIFSVYSVYLSIVLFWFRLATWLPCWERASHLAIHACCNIFVMYCAELPFPPGVCVGILDLIVQSLCLLIRKTFPRKVYPLILYFNVVKLGFTSGIQWYIYFLIFDLKYRLWVLVRTISVFAKSFFNCQSAVWQTAIFCTTKPNL